MKLKKFVKGLIVCGCGVCGCGGGRVWVVVFGSVCGCGGGRVWVECDSDILDMLEVMLSMGS